MTTRPQRSESGWQPAAGAVAVDGRCVAGRGVRGRLVLAGLHHCARSDQRDPGVECLAQPRGRERPVPPGSTVGPTPDAFALGARCRQAWSLAHDGALWTGRRASFIPIASVCRSSFMTGLRLGLRRLGQRPPAPRRGDAGQQLGGRRGAASALVMPSRPLMRSRMWSAWSSMRPKNWPTSAESSGIDESRTVAAAPLIDVSGARSSWLTVARKSARSRSRSCSGVMSWRVATTDTSSPSSERIGVAFTRVVTSLPSGRLITSSSACTVSPLWTARTTGRSSKATLDPSTRRHVSPLRSCAARASAACSPTMRRASRLAITTAGAGVHHQHPHRRRVDQSLEVGSGPLRVGLRHQAVTTFDMGSFSVPLRWWSVPAGDDGRSCRTVRPVPTIVHNRSHDFISSSQWLFAALRTPPGPDAAGLELGRVGGLPPRGRIRRPRRSQTGRRIVTVVPCPGPSLATVAVPPWASTMALVMARPRPVPPIPRLRDWSVR